MSTEGLIIIICSVLGALAVLYRLSSRITKWIADRRRKSELPYHPPEYDTGRSEPLQPCSFFIKMDYRSDPFGRFDTYGDIEVEVIGVNFGPNIITYLVPSGHADHLMRDPNILKNNTKVRQIKQQASVMFAQRWMNRELKGHYCYSKDGIPIVYSRQHYDEFLNNIRKKYLKDVK
jgi:hypothetical protein